MKSFLFIFSFLFLAATKPAQQQIEYNNRMLEKVLKKADQPWHQWTELKIPAATTGGDVLHGKYYKHTGPAAAFSYLYVGRVFSCRAGGCSDTAPVDAGEMSGEYFDYFMLFNAEAKVQEIRVFNYQATHGHEVSARGWLKQFIGHQPPQKLEVEKNIDAISGATISVYALTHDVEVKAEMLNELIENSGN